MGNFIRACFCIKKSLNFNDLNHLLEILKKHGCYPQGDTITNQGKWNEQKITLRINNDRYESRLFQLSFSNDVWAVISFDIDEQLFLQNGNIRYKPDNDQKFSLYKSILIDLISQLVPDLGQIDFEADLLCNQLNKSPIASWGNFFSYKYLELWSKDELKFLSELVDELIKIENAGILTFIHPLMANQAWSKAHEKLEKLIRSH